MQSKGQDVLPDHDQTPITYGARRLAIKHFAVLTAFILPVTLLPYFVMRQFSVLQRKVNSAGLTLTTLQSDLKRALVEATQAREGNARVQAIIDDVQLDVERLREEADERQTIRAASDDMIHSDLWKLLEERKQAGVHFTALRDLGTSLADVAAFMHEVELRQGLQTQGDGRRIERLRLLAFRMQHLPKPS